MEVKEKKTVRFAREDEQEKTRGDGKEMRGDQAVYQETVGSDIERERAASEDSEKRETNNIFRVHKSWLPSNKEKVIADSEVMVKDTIVIPQRPPTIIW